MPCCCNINLDIDVVGCVRALWPTLQLIRPKSGIKKLEKQMAILTDKNADIKNQIEQAEREGKIPTDAVIRWQRDMEVLKDEVTVIYHDFQSMSCFSCNCFHRTAGTSSQTQQEEDIIHGKSSNCCSIIRRVANKLGEAKELMSRANALDLIVRVRPPELTATVSIVHRPSVGIESYEKDIVDYIDGEKGTIIGIYGMGGIGKTTILNSIQRHYLIHNKFDRVIWVVASKDCQVKRLQTAIADSLYLKTLKEDDNEKTRGDCLFNYLKDKKCLLLLDDIWGRLDLRLLGMAYQVTEQGQQQQPYKVVVLTTRSKTVCEHMKAEKKIKVKCLDPDSAWQLFERNYEGDALSSDVGIKSLARELVKECTGLPLALVTVARAMTGKKSWKAWKDALDEIRDKHDWTNNELPEDSLIMYNAFKLSYDSLGNDSIRECLLCCALRSEDYAINIFEDLIPCWIGCGIIREFNVINKTFTKGCSHLDALLAASLLEYSSTLVYMDTEKYVKMHDVIRDMALFMVSELEVNKRKWIVKAKIGLSHLPRQEEWQEADRASFMENEITSLQYYEPSTFSKLSMLILRGNRNLKIVPSLFASMPCLTYLDIARCDITELPMEIYSSTELQYLDLSFNPITTLPAEFGCLGKLEYLILRCCKIEIVPNGTISNLSVLRWLDMRYGLFISDCWLNELKCFKGRHQLSVAIRIHDKTADTERLNMLSNVSIWDLTIRGDLSIDGDDASELPGHTIDGDDKLDLNTLQWCDNISDNLESLSIDGAQVDRLIFHESRFRSLEKLDFRHLPLLEEISLNGVALYNLRELNIMYCDMLKDVSWVLQLPSLNLLHIGSCSRMKELISDMGNSNSISSIKVLSLWYLPNLTCIANRPLHFPCLEYIQVVRCPELKKLSFGAEILNSRLKEIKGDKTWWSNLEWDNESDKNSFTPYFIGRR